MLLLLLVQSAGTFEIERKGLHHKRAMHTVSAHVHRFAQLRRYRGAVATPSRHTSRPLSPSVHLFCFYFPGFHCCRVLLCFCSSPLLFLHCVGAVIVSMCGGHLNMYRFFFGAGSWFLLPTNAMPSALVAMPAPLAARSNAVTLVLVYDDWFSREGSTDELFAWESQFVART